MKVTEIMDKPMNNFHFTFMSFGYKFRDFFLPREKILKEAEIKQGFHVLDYGCGPGSYSIVAAELVGKMGKVYALDINPLAVQRVQDVAFKRGLTNIEPIRSNCSTGLEKNSIDVVLLNDTFHGLSNPNAVLEELHRVLKPNGILLFTDHHMKENQIVSGITDRGLFRFSRKGKRAYCFLKVK